jgi:membrane fusion protein, multidrug efflux system
MKKMIFTLAILACEAVFADVYATFEAKAVKEASLNLSASGIVGKIHVDVGSHVKKGQLLLSLQDGEEQASLAMAKSEYTFLSSQYSRYQKSAEVFDKNTLDRIKAETEKAKYSLAHSEEKVAKTRLTAPFAGVIAEKNIEIGDMAGVSPKPLFRLISNETKLVLQFDSKYADGIKVGDSFCYAYDGKPSGKCAKIVKIYPAVNSDNKKLTAEAEGNGVKAGTFGDGQIKTK